MPNALDVSGFQTQVRVVTRDNQTFRLWVNSGVPVGARFEAVLQDLPIVASVKLEISLGVTAKVTVECECGYEQGIALIDSDVFLIGNVIEARIGYPRLNRWTPWFYGLMVQPEVRGTESGFSFTLSGEGGGTAAMRSMTMRDYSGQSVRRVLQSVCDRQGWSSVFPDQDASSPLDQVRQNLRQEGMTDWVFLQMIAWSANCVAFLGPNPASDSGVALFVVRRDQWLAAPSRRQFRYRKPVDWESTFPILEFETAFSTAFLPTTAGRVTGVVMNPDTGEVRQVSASSETSQSSRLGDSTLEGGTAPVNPVTVGADAPLPANVRTPGGDEVTGHHVAVVHGDAATPEEQVQTAHEDGAMGAGVNLTLKTYGVPELFPAEVVGVDGLGKKVGGNYGVVSLVHEANGDMWGMEMRLLKNAFGLMDQLHPAPEPNTASDVPTQGTNGATGTTQRVDPQRTA